MSFLTNFCANLQSICGCIRCRFACSTSSRCRRWTVGGSCRRSTAAAARSLNRRRGKVFRFFQRYGYIILLVLIGIHFLVNITAGYEMLYYAHMFFSWIDILGYIMTYVTNWIGWPIIRLWELIFFHA